MTESSYGAWHSYTWGGSIIPASPTGTLAIGFVATGPMSALPGQVTIEGVNATFSMLDLTEVEESTDPSIAYRGGIQSVDKGFTSSPILIPIPQALPTGFDIGFVESGVVTIAGVWFDGLNGRDRILEDLRTTKKCVNPSYQASPLVLVISERAYPVFITGYSSNIVGGQGNVISFRLGLAIASFNGHYA